jgi:hypothetical protein
MRIESVELIDEEVDVYDIEVEDDHSFIVKNIVLHNSAKCRALDGKIFDLNKQPIGHSTYMVPANGPPLHWNCYDKSTEAYTEEGWKLFERLDGTEKILSFNPNNISEKEFIAPIKNIKYHYSGDMIYFHSNNFSLSVTPDHNTVVKYSKIEGGVEYKFIPAKQLVERENVIFRGLEIHCTGEIIKLKIRGKRINHDVAIMYQCKRFTERTEKLKTEIIKYNDLVHCVELPKWHTLLVRHNGKVTWSGNCRSILIPILKSREELLDSSISKSVKDSLEEQTPSKRAAMNGQVAGNTTYDAWLNKQTEQMQKEILGAKKYEFWKRNSLTMSDMVDQTGNPLTLKELTDKWG